MGQEPVVERGGVSYRNLETRSLVGRCLSRRMPFEWTVNPYRGCAMGCRYCYAAYTHEFMGIDVPEQFHSLVYVKQGGEQGTARRLHSAIRRGERIALGTATDPYQPIEAQARVTRRFLELVAQYRDVSLSILTKGALILRDLDVLSRIAARSRLSVCVSLTSVDAPLLRRLEPWAPPPDVRLEVLRRLAGAGLDPGLALAPILPAITDRRQDLDAVLCAASRAGVRRMFWNILFLRSPTKEKYLRWLATEFPQHVAPYARAYATRVYLGGRYRERLAATVSSLQRRHGFADARDRDEQRRPVQLALWETGAAR
jgi:DNA repair photolyase